MGRRLLITGGTGLLGTAWARSALPAFDVTVGVHRKPVSLEGVTGRHLTLEDPAALERDLQELAPDVIVHTAALTSVDGCQRDPEAARRINVDLAANVARVAGRIGAQLIHISTDHLFSGSKAFYKEEDPVEPLNEYARTKARAEQEVQAACPGALILRTNFFGWGTGERASFSDWIVQSLRKGERLRVFRDAFFTPILMDVLIEAAFDLLRLGASGIFHAVGDERLSKADFAHKIATAFDLDRSLLERVYMSDLKLDAPRPLDMSLDNSKLKRTLGRNLGDVETFARLLREREPAGQA